MLPTLINNISVILLKKKSATKVTQILIELSREWPDYAYDLLSKNYNHFCDSFFEKLGVQNLPGKEVFIFFPDILLRCMYMINVLPIN
jgi:hypothetical protein